MSSPTLKERIESFINNRGGVTVNLPTLYWEFSISQEATIRGRLSELVSEGRIDRFAKGVFVAI